MIRENEYNYVGKGIQMLIPRCTGKVLKEMGVPKSDLEDVSGDCHPLQEWYVNLFYFNRKKCLLFTNAATLFSFVAHGVSRSEIRDIESLFRKRLSKALYDEELKSDQMKSINDKLGTFVLARTVSRSVLASMNDRTSHYEFLKSRSMVEGNIDDAGIQCELNKTPMGALKYNYPIECFMAMIEGREFEKIIPGRLKTRTAYVFEATMTQSCEGEHIMRRVAVSGNKSLLRLAQVILDAFDFDCDHCFGFYGNINKHPGREQTEVYEAFVDADVEPTNDCARSVERTKISSVFKEAGKRMLFMFDYGQDWRFVVELKEKRDTASEEKLPGVLKSVGKAPLQYPPLEEET
ncbi:plasmid pRiA4b ORF-3 family protein [bacterium]|nr:plasmid pRiA4b ORF-3 family protein [bacterium]